jgi:hypothetical protein
MDAEGDAKESKSQIKQLAQIAWNYCQDVIRRGGPILNLNYNTVYIASAAIYLASRQISYPLPIKPVGWWEILNLNHEELVKVANDITAIYKRKDAPGKVSQNYHSVFMPNSYSLACMF